MHRVPNRGALYLDSPKNKRSFVIQFVVADELERLSNVSSHFLEIRGLIN